MTTTESTKTTETTEDRRVEVETNILDGLTNLHEQVIEANTKAAERLHEMRDWTPETPELPDPNEAVQHYYEFAGKIFEANRKFAEQLVAAWYPVAKPKARKTSK